MRIDLTSLKEGKTEYWEELGSHDLDLPQNEYKLKDNLNAHYVLHKSGKNLTLSVSAKYTLQMTCSRCLKRFNQNFNEESLYIIQIGHEKVVETERELNTEDILMLFIPTTELNTVPIIRETVLLSIPMKPLCKPDCKGLCPLCGADQNKTTCQHEEQEIDRRWAPLLDLKKELSKG